MENDALCKPVRSVRSGKGPGSRDRLWALLFIGPTVAGLYAFFIYPIFASFYISLTRWDNLNPPSFVGLENYARLFRDKAVAGEFLNTLFFVAILVPLVLILSLLLANSLNRKHPANGALRTAFFLPYIMLPVVAAIVWMLMFNSRYGLVNIVLGWFSLPQPAWLANEWLVRLIVVVVSLWASLGYYSIIILAGLQNIPKDYYEACELDGISRRRQFLHITVPLVTPQLFFVAVISTIALFQMFDLVYVFGRTNIFILNSIRTLPYGIYERAFTFNDMGYASATAIVFCAVILAVTVAQNTFQKKWVHYG